MQNVYIENTLQYNASLCKGCGMCAMVCPHRVFRMNGNTAMLVAPSACMECGACQKNCAFGAIAVESGVGCAGSMIMQALTSKKQATCGVETQTAP